MSSTLSERDVAVRDGPGSTQASGRGYDWAVISGPDLDDAWVLARDPADGARVLREVAPLLDQLGLASTDLRIEPQIDADYLFAGVGRSTTLHDWLNST